MAWLPAVTTVILVQQFVFTQRLVHKCLVSKESIIMIKNVNNNDNSIDIDIFRKNTNSTNSRNGDIRHGLQALLIDSLVA